MVIDNGNPEINAGIFNRLAFWWVQKIFSVGNKRTLKEEDIFPIEPLLQSERMTALLEQEWLKEMETKEKPSLGVALLKRHRYSLLYFAIAFNVETVFRCGLPYFVARITSYFDPSIDMTLKTALQWSFAMAVIYIIYVGFRSLFYYRLVRLGSALRVGLTGLIYRKACRITQKEIGDKSVGYIVNLITNDAHRLDENIVSASVFFNLISALSMTFVIMYLEIGLYATLAGIFSILMFLPLQIALGKLVVYLREKVSLLTDSRVKTIHEIFLFIKVIKMYGWEAMFQNLVEKIRGREGRYLAIFVFAESMGIALYVLAPVTALLIVISVKIHVNEAMNIAQIYFFLSMVGVLKVYCISYLSEGAIYLSQLIHSLRRIQNFLCADEIKHLQKKSAISNLSNDVIVNKNFQHQKYEMLAWKAEKTTPNIATPEDKIVVNLQNYSAEWGSGSFALKELNLNVKRGELIAIVGPIACGKTTFLMSLLQELNYKGAFQIIGRTGFSSQVPWIFNGNIQDNILFNRAYDRDRLNKCINSCSLRDDLEQLPNGLYTVVGERGVQLSGGQKARVNLARAVYGEEPIILMDDPLSAVDSKCAKHIFNNLIKGQLSGKTRILVTHAAHFLNEVDRIVVMDTNVIENAGKNKIEGRIAHVGTYSELVAKGIKLSLFSQEVSTDANRKRTPCTVESDKELVENAKNTEVENHDSNKTGDLNRMLYIKYATMSLGWIAVPILGIAMVTPQVLSIFQQQYAIDWISYQYTAFLNITGTEGREYSTTHYNTYLILAIGTVILIIVRTATFVSVIYRSGQILHNKALWAVLRSPMQFFDTNPIGMIINRFTKDTYFMDERLAFVSNDFLCTFLLFAASVGLAMVANYCLIIPLTLLAFVMVRLVKYYLNASVELRRIEATKRSPLLSHISATLSGLATIHASRQIEVFESQFYTLRDENTRCWMLYRAASRWFAWRLDLLVTLNSVLATFITVLLRDVVGTKLMGLALVYIINMVAGFQWCIRQFTETENVMTAVERIFTFSDLPPEAPLEANKSEMDSSKIANNGEEGSPYGVIEFRNVKLRYNLKAGYILRGISFVTRPGEKIGIVGRTGAGKSTILQALFRLAEPEGEILLDGQSTKKMGLHQLRKSISIIPQESLLFSSTLRMNLDPFNEFGDEEIWDVLEKVELRSHVGSQLGGLEMMVQEGGGNLSAGQRQLLCLARALLRDNKFLVIDEATANVDETTDQLIQQTLRQKFSQCTVLTIAHRINTIIDSDRIMVIDSGRLIDFDNPAVLLNREKGIFYDLAKEAGMFDMLSEQANRFRV